jgi:hypothetical protein
MIHAATYWSSTMAEPNLMKFFISREDGTSSLLATALDPELGDNRQRLFREKFCKYVKSTSSEVDLSPDGPSVVLTEYRGMDLAMIWGDWILIVENKVAAAVNEKQLARYYCLVRTELGKKKSTLFGLDHQQLAKKRICVMFVIPTDALGRLELSYNAAELKSNRRDKKLHLSWQSILNDLDHSFPGSKGNDAFGRIIRDAVQRTKTILLENEKKSSKTIFTPERNATKKFLEQVCKRVKGMMSSKAGLKLSISQGQEWDDVDSHFGGKDGLVKLRIRASTTNLLDKNVAILKGWIEFRLSGKAVKKRSQEFNSIPMEIWAERLGVGPDFLTTAKEKCLVSHREREWSGKRVDLVEQSASLLHKFLTEFRDFMAPQKVELRKGK